MSLSRHKKLSLSLSLCSAIGLMHPVAILVPNASSSALFGFWWNQDGRHQVNMAPTGLHVQRLSFSLLSRVYYLSVPLISPSCFPALCFRCLR